MDQKFVNSCNTYEEIANSSGALEDLEYCNETNRRLKKQRSRKAYTNGRKSSPIRDGGVIAAFGGRLQVGGDGKKLPDYMSFETPEEGNRYADLKELFEDMEEEKNIKDYDLRRREHRIFQLKRKRVLEEIKELEEKILSKTEEKSFKIHEDLENVWTGPSGLFASNSSTKKWEQMVAKIGLEEARKFLKEQYRKNDFYMYTESPNDGIFNDKKIILVETELMIKHLTEDCLHVNLKSLLEELDQIKEQRNSLAA